MCSELKITVKKQLEFDIGHSPDDIDVVRNALVAENSSEELTNLKHANPSLYVAYLTLAGKTDELNALYDG